MFQTFGTLYNSVFLLLSFWQHGGLNSGIALARLVLYLLSHVPGPFLL
jgi:hypothetical protein